MTRVTEGAQTTDGPAALISPRTFHNILSMKFDGEQCATVTWRDSSDLDWNLKLTDGLVLRSRGSLVRLIDYLLCISTW